MGKRSRKTSKQFNSNKRIKQLRKLGKNPQLIDLLPSYLSMHKAHKLNYGTGLNNNTYGLLRNIIEYDPDHDC